MAIYEVSHEITKPITYTKFFSEFNREVLQIKMQEGAEIGEHITDKLAFIIVQKGTVRFQVNGEYHTLTDEQILYMEPKAKHSLSAISDVSLIVVKC